MILDVKACVNAILEVGREHGKSPCFSGVAFLRLVGPDCPSLKLLYVNGAVCLE